MLTCKSLFGLGYRGERLIELSAEVAAGCKRAPLVVVEEWTALVA